MSNHNRQQTSSTDSESEHAAFNNAFRTSDTNTTTFSSTNFTSVDANLPTDTDESVLRRLLENDTYLQNMSKNDTLSFNRGRSQSLILAAGTIKGAIANKSVESLQSTIIDGAFDSDSSFYSPSSTLTNVHLSPNHRLDKRISTDEEFADCESSPEAQTKGTLTTCSTIYKSLRLSYSLKKACSENNNTIFPETDKSADSQPSGNSDSGLTSNEPFHFSSMYPSLPPYLQHLTTILEESTVLCNTNSKISGPQLGPIVENWRKGSMPHLPQTDLFNETIETLAQLLEMSSRQITIDQLALVLLHTLQTEYSYAEHSSETESFLLSYADFSTQSDIDSNNTGMQLESIVRQLRSIFPSAKNIDSESEPDWHYSTRTPKTTLKLDPQSGGKRKEYFPSISHVEANNENINTEKTGCKEPFTAFPKKNKVRFSAEVCDFSSFNKSPDKRQKNKYVPTPRFNRNKDSHELKNINATTVNQDDSFLYWERKIILEETASQSNLRKSLSMSNIFTEESTTSEVSKLIKEIDLCSKKQKVVEKTCRFDDSKPQERSKKYYRKRRRSLEKNADLPVQTNMPSTSGIQSRKLAFRNPPTQTKLQKSRKSFGVDSSHILPVSQARMLFSPAARRAHEPQLNVPRIEISKASPQKRAPIHIVHLNKTKQKDSPRIPWRP